MSWQPATDYTTDYQPVRTMRVKKMIWSDEDQAFQTHYFLRVTCDNPRIWTDAREWLESQFGPGGYQKSWWQDPHNSLMLWMADSLATFWQLKYGDRS